MKTDNSSDQSLQGLAYHARPLKNTARVILHPEIRKSYTGQCNIITDEVTNFILSYFLQDQEENLKSKSTLPKESITDQVDIPLEYDMGDAIQMDWDEATVYINGVRTKLIFFAGNYATVTIYL